MFDDDSETHEATFLADGRITIPAKLRKEYGIEQGRKGALIPIPGAMILLSGNPRTPALFDRIRTGLGTGQMPLADMIAELRTIRDSGESPPGELEHLVANERVARAGSSGQRRKPI